MGFRGLAAIAQGVTGAAALEVGLPAEARACRGCAWPSAPGVGQQHGRCVVAAQDGEDPILTRRLVGLRASRTLGVP